VVNVFFPEELLHERQRLVGLHDCVDQFLFLLKWSTNLSPQLGLLLKTFVTRMICQGINVRGNE
jgi:hypothetical protein